MKIGDVVAPVDKRTLWSSWGFYPSAICASDEKNYVVLVSHACDMVWGTHVNPEDFRVIGRATKADLKACLARVHRDAVSRAQNIKLIHDRVLKDYQP